MPVRLFEHAQEGPASAREDSLGQLTYPGQFRFTPTSFNLSFKVPFKLSFDVLV